MQNRNDFGPPRGLFTAFFIVAMILAVIVTLSLLVGAGYVVYKVVN